MNQYVDKMMIMILFFVNDDRQDDVDVNESDDTIDDVFDWKRCYCSWWLNRCWWSIYVVFDIMMIL